MKVPIETLHLTRVDQHKSPVLTTDHPQAGGIQYGFEGGRAFKHGGLYHLFTTELVSDPFWVKTRLAHWSSPDRMTWTRLSTLKESSGEFAGQDPRAALWSPMPIYDPADDRWNLFYVAYRAAPNSASQFANNQQGQIWRAASAVAGPDGLDGPYKDVGIVLQPGQESDAWEGLMGTDSFFPYRVGERWYAFFGSAKTEKLPIDYWWVGLATAATLSGPWKRCHHLNPLPIEPVFIENPVVTRLDDGMLIAVYDSQPANTIGYSFSQDGVSWTAGRALTIQPEGTGHWSYDIRTPLGLIPEGGGLFSMFYTGSQSPPRAPTVELPGMPETLVEMFGACAVGLVNVRLSHRNDASTLSAPPTAPPPSVGPGART